MYAAIFCFVSIGQPNDLYPENYKFCIIGSIAFMQSVMYC